MTPALDFHHRLLETLIPRTVDVAESFYKGIEAFDNGNYPESLAFYLDGAREAGNFIRIYSSVITMYHLLGQNEHAVVFAGNIAQQLEQHDLKHALQFYFRAGESGLNTLNNNRLAIQYWQQIVKLAEEHEAQTHQAARTKRIVSKTIVELAGTEKYDRVSKTLSHQDVKYKIWSYGIDVQGKDMDKLGTYRRVLRDGRYVKEAVPEPSVFMWKTRAQYYLARTLIKEAKAREALDYYDAILEDYEFINLLAISQSNETRVWGRDVSLESLFMLMFHYKGTGELIRDDRRMVVLKEVNNHSVFERDFENREPDPRARVWSRREDGGHEYFDFGAPEGHQIDRVTVHLDVKGVSEMAFYLPDAKGWPPRHDFSSFMNRFTVFKGEHHRTVDFPPGTEFVSTSVLWGPRWSKNPLDLLRWKMTKAHGRDDLERLQMDFALSVKEVTSDQTLSVDYKEADSKVVKYFAEQYGWDGGVVLRNGTSTFYRGEPSRDVYALDWITYAQDGEIHILQVDNPVVRVALPVVINTDENEYDPSLVRTHEGGYG